MSLRAVWLTLGAVRIEIDFSGYEPAEGVLRPPPPSAELPFNGWLGLLVALQELTDAEETHAQRKETSK